MIPETKSEQSADSQRWQRLKSILADALEQESPAARIALVERSCADDGALLREAESLLAEAELLLRDAKDDLEECADNAATRIPRESLSQIGRRVGAYVIVREIGQGGMGTVYLTARADGYFEKQVAMKLLSYGTDTVEVLRRFRSEREVLARLDHPNIARLLDAGTTDDGLPYFLMEYVDGVPVTRFVEENGLSVKARLHLFSKICNAVEFAHRCSIVHRDLKSSNILVSHDGEPKLLDFGIAKLIGTDTNPLELTATGAQRLTPISASPEQAQGELVTISSDIYALGALLYEMVSGCRPHRFSTRNPSHAELVSVLCEQEPALPSSVVEDLRTKRLLRGDLDAIILCALQKEPAKRYSSVADLANDLQRHLAGEVLRVRESQSFYRLFRGAPHNRRVQFAGAILAAAVLCLALLHWSSLLGPLFKWGALQKDLPATQLAATLSIPERSIAVLPFDSFNPDKENSYFVDGVQDNILTDLAKVADLRVIGRMSVASYRGVAKNPKEIGRSLHVSHVLEGSIQKSGDRIRVNAHLIDTRTEIEVWAEHYERTIDDLFILQSELAQTIVSQLKATLLPGEKVAIESQPTRDMLAYDLYLRAREEFFQYNYAQAIEFLDNAVARDPKFALAYCLLTEAHLYSYRFADDMAIDRDPAHRVAAKTAADTALAFAPSLAESHLAQAQYYYYGMRDFEAAQRELAIASPPTNRARFLDLTALIERRLGHWKDAIRNGERAAELDPRNPFVINELLESYVAVRRFQDAEELASRTIQLLPPTNNSRWILKAESLLGRGQLREARATVAEAPLARPPKVKALVRLDLFARDYDHAAQVLANMPPPGKDLYETAFLEGRIARARGDIDKARFSFQVARDRLMERLVHRPNDPGILSNLSLVDAELGRKEEALREARLAVQLVPISRDALDGVTCATALAAVYVLTGEHDTALEQLAKVVKLPGGPNYGQLRFDPAWDEIRANPKFEKITAEGARPPFYE